MERNLTMIALLAALIAALGLIPSFTLAFGVPITAQTLGVMLCGTLLGAKRGALAVLLFLALVALGLPLLAGGRGGLGVFASPSFGFLIGWPVGAFVTGLVMSNWRRPSTGIAAGVAAMIGGVGAVYAFGIMGLLVKLDMSVIEATVASAAFIPGDLIKAVLTGIITASVAKARPHAILSRS